MSAVFSSRALRTLRRLARPAIALPLPQTPAVATSSNFVATPLRLTLFRGGEGITPLVRRRFRRALLNISAQNKLPFTVYGTVRYGTRSFQDRRFNHPQLAEIRSLLCGEILSLELGLRPREGKPITPAILQIFLQQITFILNRDFGLNFSPSSDTTPVTSIGPSRRLLRIALPALSSLDQSLENNTFKRERFRPKAIEGLVKTALLTPDQTIISTLQYPVAVVVGSVEALLGTVNPIISSFSAPHYSILRSLAFRAQGLLKF